MPVCNGLGASPKLGLCLSAKRLLSGRSIQYPPPPRPSYNYRQPVRTQPAYNTSTYPSSQPVYYPSTSQPVNYEHQNVFYLTPRFGFGGTFIDDETVSAPIIDVAIGMYAGYNFRGDVEIGYHFKSEVVDDIDYSQLDVSLNGYYDFDTGTAFKPFIGVGIGAATSELSVDGYYDDYDWDETNFMISAQIGASIDLTQNIAFEVMGRYRYLFTEGDVYNIEGLGGVRFSF